jgi:hypothetical protein
MSEAVLRETVVRMATEESFAEAVRRDPAGALAGLDLTAAECDQLAGLSADAGAGAAGLGERLSKSSLFFASSGGAAHAASPAGHVPLGTGPHELNPQPLPPGGEPHATFMSGGKTSADSWGTDASVDPGVHTAGGHVVPHPAAPVDETEGGTPHTVGSSGPSSSGPSGAGPSSSGGSGGSGGGGGSSSGPAPAGPSH